MGCILARNFRVTGLKENHVPLAVTSQVTVSGFGIQVSRELWSYVIQTFTFRASFFFARNFGSYMTWTSTSRVYRESRLS